MSETTSYPCPQCGATLKLDPETTKLKCDFCDGIFDVDAIEQKVDETSYARKTAKHGKRKGYAKKHFKYQAPDGIATRSIEEWEALLAEGTEEQFDDVVGYTCATCGGQVVTDKLTVATSCQYCGGSVVVDERLSGGLKPGYVIPFKVKADDLPTRLTEFYKDRPLLPKNFFYENQVGEVQGIYVPFWLYDGKVEGRANYTSQVVNSYTSGKYDVTETTKYTHEREGYIEFVDVPVDASERIDDDLMDSIEPFDYNDMVEFKPGFLTGFVAERFDQSPREVFQRAGNRMTKTAQSEFAGSVSRPVTSTTGSSFAFAEAAASYVFLPVYLFNCRYMGKMFRYAVNGQTGKIVGEVPTGKKESLVAWAKAAVKGFAISFVVLAVVFGLGMFLD